MYTVIELQTTGGVTVAGEPVVKATIEEARQEYHMKGSYAAVSTVEVHTIMLVNAEGQNAEKPICYKHQAQEQAAEE